MTHGARVTDGPPACEASPDADGIDATGQQHRTPAQAFVAIGANLGDARGTVLQAFAQLGALAGCTLVARSSLWRSTPVDAPGPDYVNAAAHLSTTLPPHVLLTQLQAIETVAGRVRGFHHAPRTLDLDLLLYDTLRIATTRLTIPHPRMHLRAFVLAPLAELQGSLHIPGHGLVSDLLATISDQPISRMPDAP